MDPRHLPELSELSRWFDDRQRRSIDDPDVPMTALAAAYISERPAWPFPMDAGDITQTLEGFRAETLRGSTSAAGARAPNGGRRDVVLSGIRATGRLHLGNYLGVLERFAAYSRDATKRCYFFVADLHTLTTHKEAELIRAHAPDIVMDMLAAGVAPDRATIYIQSRVPAVTELAWYLGCLTPVGDLERLPTYKEKREKHPEDVNGGLFSYPVLMAADILGPRADLVPVGKDQQPHLELTQEIARRFNARFKWFFPVPDGLAEESITVPALAVYDDEHVTFGKMGKSEAPQQTLFLSDDDATVAEKIRRSPTDPARARRTDSGNPQKCAIFALHSLMSSTGELQWSAEGCRTAGISCVECKDVLTKNVRMRLAEFHERRRALGEHPERIEEILTVGSARAAKVFEETTAEVADRMGVYRPARRRT